jgi:CubicO group peptidase (beta-lactamase class C family)
MIYRSTRGRLLALVLAVAAGGKVSSQERSAAAPAELASGVDELFAKWNRQDSPGCAVGIVRDGELIYSKGFGSADLEHKAPNTPQTVFEMASFSKSLTCVCVALLMDEGKIAPGDELGKFVPQMHSFNPPIRVQDLVRCKSGVWDQISLPILVGWDNAPRQAPLTEADFLSLLAGQKTLPFRPGTEFRYGSGDYFLLAQIVKRVSGQSLAQFARERIFQPLGMSRTFFDADPTLVVSERAVGHYKPDGEAWHLWRPTTDGGFRTCVEDLYRWDRCFQENRLPRGKYLDEFLQEGTLLGNRYCLDVDAYVKEVRPETRRDSPPGQYRGLKRRQFTGGAWGFGAAMSQFPEQRFTVICLSNCDEIVPWTINSKIADLHLADRLQARPSSTAGPPPSELPTVAVSAEELRDKVGAYRMQNTGAIWQIALKDGRLEVLDHLLKSTPLRPLAADRFDPDGPRFYSTTQFVFSRPAADAPLRFTSEWDEPGERGSLVFEAVKLVNPTGDELTEYAGEYVSEELAATYRVAVRDGQILLRVNSRRWEQLDATVADEFVPHVREPADGRIFTFLRNGERQVTGLSVKYFRIDGVRFAKR